MNKVIKLSHPDFRYINVNQDGIVGHSYGNGVELGDGASWTGHFKYFGKKYEYVNDLDYVKTFEVAFGGYVRAPKYDPVFNRFGSFYKNTYINNISRDQGTGVMLGIIAAGDKAAMARYCLSWAARGFLFAGNTVHNGQEPSNYKFNLVKFFSNPKQEPYYKIPDPTGPAEWAMALRGFGLFSWLFWPLLCVLDLWILIMTYFINKTKKDDVMNHLARLAVSRDYVPTPTSWLSAKLLDKDHMDDRLAEYWIGWRDQPGMYDIHVKAMEELK